MPPSPTYQCPWRINHSDQLCLLHLSQVTARLLCHFVTRTEMAECSGTGVIMFHLPLWHNQKHHFGSSIAICCITTECSTYWTCPLYFIKQLFEAGEHTINKDNYEDLKVETLFLCLTPTEFTWAQTAKQHLSTLYCIKLLRAD